ncbi:MAG: ATP-grasp domain-containing protein [Gemmatimonadales bacterium]|nr:ATP-grasp domain-containing protein [Gemmatimonadales bacterium]
MKVAVVFDTPYARYEPDDHRAQMVKEVGGETPHEPEMEYQVGHALEENGHEVVFAGIRHDPREILDRCAEWKPELVVNCAESFRGDSSLDYLFPALLEAGGYRYTGSPPLGLQVSRDKAMSKKILAFHGIKVPGFVSYHQNEEVEKAPDLKFPLIVKPNSADASEGIAQASVVETVEALAERVAFIHERFTQPAIAEEFIIGRELYVSMIGNGKTLELLPLTELVFDKEKNAPEERFATQSAKWDEAYRQRKGVRNVFARPVSADARARIDAICRTAYAALWLRDYARIDIRLTDEDEVWVLEANANPFISKGHEIANAADKAGMPYQQFIQRIVDEAVSRYDAA